MQLVYTLSQIGNYDVSDINIVEGYFYMFEHAKQSKREADEIEKMRKK